jgi:diguanylate cyclase (GGDEF)-like protein
MGSDPPDSDDDTPRALDQLNPRDELTGGFSRAAFDERLAVVFASAVEYGESLALLLIDVDHFADFNERHGRAAGDVALAAIRARISEALGVTDIVARLAEDEFAVLCRKAVGDYGAQLAQRLRTRISTYAIAIPGAEDAYFLNVSVGVCLFPASGITKAADFLAAAEACLRQAKQTGRDRVCVSSRRRTAGDDVKKLSTERLPRNNRTMLPFFLRRRSYMKVVKAITLREPSASRIAAGEETAGYKGFRTAYRGEILIVADEEPWYGLALAELVDVRPISPSMHAPLERGFAWVFANVVRITRFPVAHRSGLFTAEVPEGALPSAMQLLALSEQPVTPTASDQAVRVAVARELRMARAGMRTATRGFGELVAKNAAIDGHPEALKRFENAASRILTQTEDLIADMVRLDTFWRRELAPRTTDDDVIAAELGVSTVRTTWRRPRLDVLVVEDEPKMARGVQRSLSLDHDVRLANTKQEALAQLRERVPDVLLCDHRLDWQKTDDLFEYVRDNHPRVRRVLYSFSNLEVWHDLLHRKVVDAVVPKSAPRNALLSALF